MIKVPGHRILVKLTTFEEEIDVPEALKTSGFIIKHESSTEEHRTKVASERGKVLAIGPMCWKHRDHGFGLEGWSPWCKVGDEILFGKFAGKLFTDPQTKEEYFLINDDDVQVVLEEAP